MAKNGTDLLQVPSYVVKLPTGKEKGICLAIDLGGTNLRVCSVELHGNSTHSLVQSKVAIPQHLMTAKTYKDLFHFIAKHTESFMLQNLPGEVENWRKIVRDNRVTDKVRNQHAHSLGFTFSFTFDQHAINKGTLMYWTKAFSIDDAVGRDPCEMLQEAFDDIHLPLVVKALVNDTVGTLAARAYAAPGTSQTLLAAIFGTGTNGAYMERISNITKLHTHPDFSSPSADEFMALNTEWGGFDRDLTVLPTTSFDRELDRDSVNPDDQHYEKRISGLYLGELLRRVLLADLNSTTPCLGFKAKADSKVHTAYSIDSSLLSAIVQDSSPDLEVARMRIARDLDTTPVSVADAEALKTVAGAIGRRAARLSAIAIAGVVIQSGRLFPPKSDCLPSIHDKPASSESRPSHKLRNPLRFIARLCGLWTTSSQQPKAIDDQSSGSGYASEEKESAQSGEIIDIGVDGSLFEFFPGFEDHMRSALREITEIGPAGERRIRFGAAADGSGIGAALVAWSS